MGFGHPLLATLVLIIPAFGCRRSGRPPCEPLEPALRKEYPPLRVGGWHLSFGAQLTRGGGIGRRNKKGSSEELVGEIEGV